MSQALKENKVIILWMYINSAYRKYLYICLQLLQWHKNTFPTWSDLGRSRSILGTTNAMASIWLYAFQNNRKYTLWVSLSHYLSWRYNLRFPFRSLNIFLLFTPSFTARLISRISSKPPTPSIYNFSFSCNVSFRTHKDQWLTHLSTSFPFLRPLPFASSSLLFTSLPWFFL